MTSRPKNLLLAALILALALVSLRGYIRIMEPVYLFHPPGGLQINPSMMEMEYRDVTMESGRFRIHGWLLPKKEAAGYVVFFHGNAENVSHRVGFAKALAPLKANILLVDYRGYGISEGTPSIEGVAQDAVAALEWLHVKHKVPLDRIVLWGFSLGGAAALAVAEKYPAVAGVVVESSFISLRTFATEIFPWIPAALVTDAMDNGAIAGRLATPKLFIHGTADTIIPFSHGQAFYEMAAGPKYFLVAKGAGHGNALEAQGAPERTINWIQERLENASQQR
ncbi:MAG: alpha/beta hydrolase [Nitrospinae bacterium]|nr:alpha/beta hydrolase [Nitrospinota bacterium]